jgi:hypothetical protein
MRSRRPSSRATGPSWYVCPGQVNGATLNSRAKIAQAMDEIRQKLREAKIAEEQQDAALTLEALRDERRRHEQIIQKGKRTRLKNKLAARYKRMGGQTEPPSLRLGSLFDSGVKKADDAMIVDKSEAGCDAAGKPRKKKRLQLRKRRLPSGSRGERTASEA